MTGGSGRIRGFLKIGGLSRFVTIPIVEVDGRVAAAHSSNGGGIRMNDLSVKHRRAIEDIGSEGASC